MWHKIFPCFILEVKFESNEQFAAFGERMMSEQIYPKIGLDPAYGRNEVPEINAVFDRADQEKVKEIIEELRLVKET